MGLLSHFALTLLLATETEKGKVRPFPVDLSLYEGRQSFLLEWHYPDSILANTIRIYVKKSGDDKFELRSELGPESNKLLDIGCEPLTRYFYFVEIEDPFGQLFTSDHEMPVFGTCRSMDDSTRFVQEVENVADIYLIKIMEQATELNPYQGYDNVIKLLQLTTNPDKTWLENYPMQDLRNAGNLISIIDPIIQDEHLMEAVQETEFDFRNALMLNPQEWESTVEQNYVFLMDHWNKLYDSYEPALARFEEIAPIRIIGGQLQADGQKDIFIHLFHPDRVNLNETFLLSGDEYVDLRSFQVEDDLLISVRVPEDWDHAILMMGDIFIHEFPFWVDSSMSLTLDEDMVPSLDPSLIKVSRDESSLWFNELVWNPATFELHMEVAGQPQYDYYYSFKIDNQMIWELETMPGFEIQFFDSSFIVDSMPTYPIVLSFNRQIENDWMPLDFIILDTVPVSIHRQPDGDSWHNTETATLGMTNDDTPNEMDAELIPEFFVLYQNYPNPFNAQTRISFDLLEDAIISLFVTDATGRVQDIFSDQEFTTAGIYNYEWSGEGRSTGIYFFTIQAQIENFQPVTLSRKMVYLK